MKTIRKKSGMQLTAMMLIAVLALQVLSVPLYANGTKDNVEVLPMVFDESAEPDAAKDAKRAVGEDDIAPVPEQDDSEAVKDTEGDVANAEVMQTSEKESRHGKIKIHVSFDTDGRCGD